PRIEGLFARIERLVPKTSGEVHWQATTPDNVTHIYGSDSDSQVVDPKDPSRVMTWDLMETGDDKGNVTRYEYKREDGVGVDPTRLSERSHFDYSSAPPSFQATAQTYLKRVFYGNKVPSVGAVDSDFLFEMVFDYGEHAAATSS